MHGSSQGSPAAFRRLVRYIEAGKMRPLLAGTCRLSDLHRAQVAFMSNEIVGKLVVIPDARWDGARPTACSPTAPPDPE